MKIKGHQARLIVICLFFSLILLILLWRMYDLMILNRPFLKGQGDARSLRSVSIPAYRGMIIDRLGSPLAISTPVQTVWLNPKVFSANHKQMAALATLLKIKPNQLAARVARAKKRGFLYLQRQIPPAVAKKIAHLDIPGLYFQEEFKRYYPAGESTAQLLGFTDIDDQGLEGLELAYNDWLRGVMGKRRVVKDRIGRIVADLGVLKEPRPGHALQLSIDHRIQYIAYHELQKTIEQFGAKSGSVLVIDTQTGEVLAVSECDLRLILISVVVIHSIAIEIKHLSIRLNLDL